MHLNKLVQSIRGGGGEDDCSTRTCAAAGGGECATQERGAGKEKGSFHFHAFTSIPRQEKQGTEGGNRGWRLLVMKPKRSRSRAEP